MSNTTTNKEEFALHINQIREEIEMTESSDTRDMLRSDLQDMIYARSAKNKGHIPA